MKKIISVINQKGGVGKTTISINLASGLALENQSTLLIDMDPQANSTQGIGIEPNEKHGIHLVLLNKQTVQNAVVNTKINNLNLIPSHLNLGNVEGQTDRVIWWRETMLAEAIKQLDYNFIIIDCGPHLDLLTVNAIFAADLIFVPLDMTKFALDGLANVMDTINAVKRNESVYDITRIVFNKYDLRKKSHNEWYQNQLVDYQDMILKTIVHQDSVTEHAQTAENSVFGFGAGSRATEDFKNLTKEILNLCQ